MTFYAVIIEVPEDVEMASNFIRDIRGLSPNKKIMPLNEEELLLIKLKFQCRISKEYSEEEYTQIVMRNR